MGWLFMHIQAVLCALTFFSVAVPAVFGQQHALQGGKSPDGAYEMRVVSQDINDDPHGYGLHLFKLGKQDPIFTLPTLGGYLYYASALERDHAYWHASSRFVAITDQATRHSREVYIAALDAGGDSAAVLQAPDFYQNALGRVNAVAIDFASVVTPQKWDGDDLILELYFTANGRRAYTFEVILHLSHGPNSAPYLSLKSVKKLKEGEG